MYLATPSTIYFILIHYFYYSSTYTGGLLRSHVKPSLAFEAFRDPVDTSAQEDTSAALAPQQATEQEESADRTFMAM
jgi:hypothetical protein